MNKMNIWAGPLVLTLVLSACGHESVEQEGPAPEAKVVENIDLYTVQRTSVSGSRSLAGTVRARSSFSISPRVMAQVERIHGHEGQRVRKGDVLVELDDREFQARLTQAESAMGQAEVQRELAAATLKRYQTLLEGRAVSQQEYDVVAAQEKAAREAVRQAEAAVSEAGTYLGFTRIVAPAAGIVVRKHMDPGALAAPGAPVLTIEEPRYQVEVPLDSSRSGSMAPGSRFQVEVDAAGFSGELQVTEVVPSVDPMSRTFIVRADLPERESLRSGQYARVSMPDIEREVLIIPETAVVRRGQLDGVYLVPEDGIVRFRLVKTGGLSEAGQVEVLSGLSDGDQLVARDTEGVSEGVRVVAGQAP